MNKLFVVALCTVLAGCAVAPQGPGYGNRAYAQPRDPSQWRVVSVTPVPAGTAARIASNSPDGKPIEYSSSTAPQHIYNNSPMYSQAPVYHQAPVYAPAPVYYPEPAYYWPPVTLSLGFIFGRHWSSGHGRAHFRGGRRHR